MPEEMATFAHLLHRLECEGILPRRERGWFRWWMIPLALSAYFALLLIF
jgi:hypothetical protein